VADELAAAREDPGQRYQRHHCRAVIVAVWIPRSPATWQASPSVSSHSSRPLANAFLTDGGAEPTA